MSPLQIKIIEYLASNGTSISSKTLAFYLGFGVIPEWSSHPHDPADLYRCIKFLDQAPELRTILPKMRVVSKEWEKLISSWDILETIFRTELRKNGPQGLAIKTYKFMKELGL